MELLSLIKRKSRNSSSDSSSNSLEFKHRREEQELEDLDILTIPEDAEAEQSDIVLKGQCPDYAHARALSVFSSKDNRPVKLTRQDFLPDRTADGDLLFIFSGNISNFRRNLSSYLKFGSRHEDSSPFYR